MESKASLKPYGGKIVAPKVPIKCDGHVILTFEFRKINQKKFITSYLPSMKGFNPPI